MRAHYVEFNCSNMCQTSLCWIDNENLNQSEASNYHNYFMQWNRLSVGPTLVCNTCILNYVFRLSSTYWLFVLMVLPGSWLQLRTWSSLTSRCTPASGDRKQMHPSGVVRRRTSAASIKTNVTTFIACIIISYKTDNQIFLILTDLDRYLTAYINSVCFTLMYVSCSWIDCRLFF